MPQKIILNDGTELAGHIMENGDDRIIFVYLTGGVSMLTGIALFSDPAKTRTIRMISFGHEHTYQGYTQVESVSKEYGNCNLVMSKGA